MTNRDVLTMQPCSTVFGLIGFSGRRGRDAQMLAFMSGLAPHYHGDLVVRFTVCLCAGGNRTNRPSVSECRTCPPLTTCPAPSACTTDLAVLY